MNQQWCSLKNEPVDEPLTIFQWNVLAQKFAFGSLVQELGLFLPLEERVKEMIRIIKSFENLDIICLEEVDFHELFIPYFQDQYNMIWTPTNKSKNAHGVFTLIKKEIQIVSQETLTIVDDQDKNIFMKCPLIHLQKNETQFFLCVVHLKSRRQCDPIRQKQIQVIHAKFESIFEQKGKIPAFWVGDFNACHDWQSSKLIESLEWKSSYPLTKGEFTFYEKRKFIENGNVIFDRLHVIKDFIDYIYYKNVNGPYSILSTPMEKDIPFLGWNTSDHFPIIATFSLSRF